MIISRKKIIFITAGAVVLIALALVLIVNVKRMARTPEESAGETNKNIPIFSAGELADSPDLDEIRKSVQNELINTQKNVVPIAEKSYQDSSGRQIRLNDFINANGLKIEAGLLQNSSQKDYASYACAKGKDERPAIGIMFQQRRDVDSAKYQRTFSEMEKDMTKWEKAIFNELGPLFFPEESFKEEPKFYVSSYTTSNKANIVQIHYANLTSASEKKYSIDYGFLNDNLLISNDKNCLRRMLDQNADSFDP